MGRKIYGIFVAGGKGTRMGGDTPKQFLDLGGRTVLHRTIERFLQAEPRIGVIVVLPQGHIADWKEICIRDRFDRPQTIVDGGPSRFHSVRNALAQVPDGAIVSIHDGVRPLVSAGLIRHIFDLAQDCPGVVPVTPVTDTLKSLSVQDGHLAQTDSPDPSREGLYGAQTPQVFHSELIRRAYQLPFDTSFTDDASVARRAGIPLTYVTGERYNIKLTTPEDLDVARKLLL